MDKKKETWGFDAPNIQVQQWLDETKRLLESKEINWGNELVHANELLEKADELVNQEMGKPEKDRWGLRTADEFSRYWYMRGLIIRLGLDVLEISKQVAEIHKLLKDMKLAIK